MLNGSQMSVSVSVFLWLQETKEISCRDCVNIYTYKNTKCRAVFKSPHRDQITDPGADDQAKLVWLLGRDEVLEENL